MGFATYAEEPYQDIYGAMRFPGNPVTANNVANDTPITSSIASQNTPMQNTIGSGGGVASNGAVGSSSSSNNNSNSNGSGNGRDGGWITRDYSDFQNCRVLCTLLYDSDDDETPVSYLKNPPIEYKAAILNQIKARGLGYTQGKDGRSIGPVMKVEIKVNVLTSKHEGMNFRVAIELVDDATWTPLHNSRVVVPHIRVISKPEPTHIKRKYVRHKEVPPRPNKKPAVDGCGGPSESGNSSTINSDNKSLINTNECICTNLSNVGGANPPTVNNSANNANLNASANANSLGGGHNTTTGNNATCCHCCTNAASTNTNVAHSNTNDNGSSTNIIISSESRMNEDKSNNTENNTNVNSSKSSNSNAATSNNSGNNRDKSNSSFINETVLALLNKIEAKEDENHRALDNLSATISRSSSLAASYFCSPAPSYVPTTAASPSLQSASTQATGPSPFALAEAVAAVATSSGGSSSSLAQSTPTKPNKAAPPKTSGNPKGDGNCSSLLQATEDASKQDSNGSERKYSPSSRSTPFSAGKSEGVANFCGNCEHFLDLYSKLSDSEKEGEIRSYLSNIDLDRKNKLIEFASLVLNNCLVKNDFI